MYLKKENYCLRSVDIEFKYKSILKFNYTNIDGDLKNTIFRKPLW